MNEYPMIELDGLGEYLSRLGLTEDQVFNALFKVLEIEEVYK